MTRHDAPLADKTEYDFFLKKGALPYIDRAPLIHPIISSFTAALGQVVDYVANMGEKVDEPLV